MVDKNQRRSIWDMNAQDTTLYLILFITLMLLGTAYILWYRVGVEQLPSSERAFVFVKDLGQAGVSAAVSAFTLVVVRRGIMALIDWPSKEKYRAEMMEAVMAGGTGQSTMRRPGVPDSFNLLCAELRSLGLKIEFDGSDGPGVFPADGSLSERALKHSRELEDGDAIESGRYTELMPDGHADLDDAAGGGVRG